MSFWDDWDWDWDFLYEDSGNGNKKDNFLKSVIIIAFLIAIYLIYHAIKD